MFVQNFIELSAVVHELSRRQRKKLIAENNTALLPQKHAAVWY